jgi:hypothetical protein
MTLGEFAWASMDRRSGSTTTASTHDYHNPLKGDRIRPLSRAKSTIRNISCGRCPPRSVRTAGESGRDQMPARAHGPVTVIRAVGTAPRCA